MSDDTIHSIILADDDKFLLDMYKHKFDAAGYQVSTARDGEEVLALIRGGLAPHVLLLDILMPKMSGLEVLKVMRKENLASDATVIMLTNQGNKEELEEARGLHVDGYIVKAMTIPSEVLEEVRKIHAIKHQQ